MRSRFTRSASHKIEGVVAALVTAFLHGPKEGPAEEGLAIILVMLFVGLTFLTVILLGQLTRWLSHRRHAARR